MKILRVMWLDIVNEYSRLGLAFETYRLATLSGLTAQFSRPILSKYLSRIQEKDLCYGLL